MWPVTAESESDSLEPQVATSEDELAPVSGGRKAEIREAALTLFAERGYHGTSMEDLGRYIGVRAPSLYNHLRSKEDLLIDIMVTTMRDLLADFEKANRSGTPAERVRLAMEAHVRYHALHQRDVRIGNREISSLEKPARNLVVSLRAEYQNKWQQLIDSGVQMGDFTIPSRQLAVYAILEMGIGVSQWYRSDGPLSLDQIADQYGEMASRLLGADVEEREVVLG
jgi:AcrR family transcriptional regulator